MLKIVFITVLLILPEYVFSQWSIGIKGGMNLSHAKYIDAADEDLIDPVRKLKPGFVAGIKVNNQFSEVLGAEVELLYSEKGLKSVQIPYNKAINAMNYLELPLNGNIILLNNGSSTFRLNIGAYAAYWLFGKYKYEDLTSGEKQIDKVDFKSTEYQYNRFDYGVIGAVILKFDRTSFFINYDHSMSGSSQLNADGLTNRVLSFGIVYDIINI